MTDLSTLSGVELTARAMKAAGQRVWLDGGDPPCWMYTCEGGGEGYSFPVPDLTARDRLQDCLDLVREAGNYDIRLTLEYGYKPECFLDGCPPAGQAVADSPGRAVLEAVIAAKKGR